MTGLQGIGAIEMLVVAVIMANGVWNTAVGSTGGVAFATLAATMGPAVAIPVQSVVEGTSAGYRIWHLREQINFGFVGAFAVGGVFGGALGFPVLTVALMSGADDLLTLLVAFVILAMTWLPLARQMSQTRLGPALTGAITTFLSLFVGGMGAPISAAVESRGEPHPVVVATYTTALYLQYVMRLALFGLTGAIIGDHLTLIVMMVIASVFGTWLGARLVFRADPDRTRYLFRATVTIIAIVMVIRVVR